jgi:3'(2'), 5'-bisphosphate nucleotidase
MDYSAENQAGLLQIAIEAALKGGDEILEVYSQDFDFVLKQDKSPLTQADRQAHDAIVSILAKTGLPVLSEEGKSIPYEIRKNWKSFWMVDPLDGTKEFIKRNGEFTVNIALINEGKAEMGVIFVPVSGLLYFACDETGARKTMAETFKKVLYESFLGNAERLPLQYNHEKMIVVCSRSHMSTETTDYINSLRKSGHDLDFVSIGSSLKLCLVAEGKAHVYPRFGPTMEWDTAAGQAIAEKAGCNVLQIENQKPVNYNKPDLLNPWFIVTRIQ